MDDARVEVWHYCSMAPARDGKPSALSIGSPVAEDKLDALHSATDLLSEVCEGAEFLTLQRRYADLKASIELCTSISNVQHKPALDKVSDSLEALLTTLRAFDDRTAHDLSERYGAKSKIIEGFKASLSAEYDANFAYRFCARLRNYDQHYESPIAGMRSSSSLGADGKVKVERSIYFDASRLLASKYNGWSTVKADLEQIDGEFELEPIIDSLMESCARIHCKLVLSREQELGDAADLILQVAQEAAPDGVGPGLAKVPKDFNDNIAMLKTLNLNLRPIRFELALRAQSEIVVAKRIRDLSSPEGGTW